MRRFRNRPLRGRRLFENRLTSPNRMRGNRYYRNLGSNLLESNPQLLFGDNLYDLDEMDDFYDDDMYESDFYDLDEEDDLDQWSGLNGMKPEFREFVVNEGKKFYTANEIIKFANISGDFVIDAKYAIKDLAVAYGDRVPAKELYNVLANYDLEMEDLMEDLMESVELVHVYDDYGKMFGTGELLKTKGKKSLIRWDGYNQEWVDSDKVQLVEEDDFYDLDEEDDFYLYEAPIKKTTASERKAQRKAYAKKKKTPQYKKWKKNYDKKRKARGGKPLDKQRSKAAKKAAKYKSNAK